MNHATGSFLQKKYYKPVFDKYFTIYKRWLAIIIDMHPLKVSSEVRIGGVQPGKNG